MAVLDLFSAMLSACCANPFIGAGLAKVSFEPNICSRMAWKEWPGSQSTKKASSETKISGEFGSETEMRLDSVPVRPSISGRVDLSQPRTWSKDRFSMTRITRVLMGPLMLVLCLLRKFSKSRDWEETTKYTNKIKVMGIRRLAITADRKQKFRPPSPSNRKKVYLYGKSGKQLIL